MNPSPWTWPSAPLGCMSDARLQVASSTADAIGAEFDGPVGALGRLWAGMTSLFALTELYEGGFDAKEAP